MIEEVLEPFLEKLGKYQKLGLNTEVNKMCMGLLLGLYRFEHESTTWFKDWAPDAPSVFAEAVVDAWKQGSPARADIREESRLASKRSRVVGQALHTRLRTIFDSAGQDRARKRGLVL